jgi:hypothetical protein
MAAAIRGAQCDREVDEFTAVAERWKFWSDGETRSLARNLLGERSERR